MTTTNPNEGRHRVALTIGAIIMLMAAVAIGGQAVLEQHAKKNDAPKVDAYAKNQTTLSCPDTRQTALNTSNLQEIARLRAEVDLLQRINHGTGELVKIANQRLEEAGFKPVEVPEMPNPAAKTTRID